MKTVPEFMQPEQAKLLNIVDMALGFSAMIRLFESGSKARLRGQIVRHLSRVFLATSEEEVRKAHHEFCTWGVSNLTLAGREKGGKVVKAPTAASYGQLAKTFDVVLHVAIHYCHLPDCDRAGKLVPWLNTAMDTKMMAELRGYYPAGMHPWPRQIEDIRDRATYEEIQKLVRRCIVEKHKGKLSPVQYDDVHWRALSRPADT